MLDRIVKVIINLAACWVFIYLGTYVAAVQWDAGHMMVSNLCLMTGWLMAIVNFIRMWKVL